jgi:hypothetical protein
MPTSIAVRASVRCPECSAMVPLNGLHPRAGCPSCQAAFAVDDERAWWEDQDCLDGWIGAACMDPANEELTFDFSDDVRLVCVRRDAACPGCAAAIPAAEVAAALEPGSCACPSCQRAVEVRAPAEGWRAKMPWLRAVAGEAPAVILQQKPGQAVAYLCASCGGALTPVAGERTVTCEYCGASALTPDPEALRREEWFWLVVEPDERTTLHWSLRALDQEGREKAAGDPATPPAALELLAGFEDWTLERLVAGNPAAPPSALTKLAGSEDNETREALAANPSAPAEALLALCQDDHEFLREKIAERPELPPEVQLRLAGDSSSLVRHALANRKKLGGQEVVAALLAEGDDDTCAGIARNDDAPAAALERLAGSSSRRVREAVARHRNTPGATLAKLARDPEYDVRLAVAKNQAAPGEVLELLASGDSEDRVTQCARKNPFCPPRPWWKKLFGG